MSKNTETPEQALQRIQSMGFCDNDALVVMHFYNCGIDPDKITPRENVLTFRAWKAKGRQVAKGATGFAFTTWIPCKQTKKQREKGDSEEKLRPKTTRVFHECQTISVDDEKGTRPEAWNNPALVKAGTYEPEPQCHESPEPLYDVHGASESDNVKAYAAPRIVHEETLELNEDGDLVPVQPWADDTPDEQIEREMSAALTAPDTSSVESVEHAAKNCACPMAGVVTNVDCPIHGTKSPHEHGSQTWERLTS